MKRVDAVPAKDLTVGWMCCQRGETAKNGRPSSWNAFRHGRIFLEQNLEIGWPGPPHAFKDATKE